MVVDVQANLLNDLATRVVVPLAPLAAGRREDIPRLNPILRIGEKEYYFKPTELAAIPKSLLRDPVANIEAAHRAEIVGALDFMLQGF